MSTISSKSGKGSMVKNMINKMMATMMPREEEDIRISINGTIVVKTQTADGKEWIDAAGVMYPDSALMPNLKAYTIAKTPNQVQVGDVIKVTTSTLATVVSVDGDKIETLTFGGQHRQAKAFKDFLLGQKTVRVVINLFGGLNVAGGNNMMALALMNEDGDLDIEDLLMMQMMQNPSAGAGFGNLMSNPIVALKLMGEDKGSDSFSELMKFQLLSQAMGGGTNLFGNLFGGCTCGAKTPTAPVADPAPVAEAPAADAPAQN